MRLWNQPDKVGEESPGDAGAEAPLGVLGEVWDG